MYQNLINSEFNEFIFVLNNFIKNKINIESIEKAAILLSNSFKCGNKVLSCGNGGSHCDAMHFAEELTGCYRKKREGYPAIAISDVSHFSCVGNDFGFDYVFSRYIDSVGVSGDVLFAISTSGNSKNIINAINSANTKGMKVILLTGKNGGKIINNVDLKIIVSHGGYSDRIQEIHSIIIHIIIRIIEQEMLNKNINITEY